MAACIICGAGIEVTPALCEAAAGDPAITKNKAAASISTIVDTTVVAAAPAITSTLALVDNGIRGVIAAAGTISVACVFVAAAENGVISITKAESCICFSPTASTIAVICAAAAAATAEITYNTTAASKVEHVGERSPAKAAAAATAEITYDTTAANRAERARESSPSMAAA